MGAAAIRIRVRRVRDGAILYDSGQGVASASEMMLDTDMSPAANGDYAEQYIVEACEVDYGPQDYRPGPPKAYRQTLLGFGLHR